jgi:hypothetical protein
MTGSAEMSDIQVIVYSMTGDVILDPSKASSSTGEPISRRTADYDVPESTGTDVLRMYTRDIVYTIRSDRRSRESRGLHTISWYGGRRSHTGELFDLEDVSPLDKRRLTCQCRVRVKYISGADDLPREYVDTQSVFTGLPLTVNVQDFFRPDR